MTFHTNAMNILDQSADRIHKKIYNSKTNRMIIINRPVYHKLLLREYMHWREKRILILPLHELLILIKCDYNTNLFIALKWQFHDYIFFLHILSIHNFQIYAKHLVHKVNWLHRELVISYNILFLFLTLNSFY